MNRRAGGPAGKRRDLLRRVLSSALLFGAMAVAAIAQEGRYAYPIREGVPEHRAGFMFCRLLYTPVRREALGLGWSTDYPRSDINFMARLPLLTSTAVSKWDDGEEGHAVVRATDPTLFQCPFLFASDAGTAGFSDAEAARLREYLLKGGFFWIDDFWGEAAMHHFLGEMQRVIPEYSVIDLPPDHPLFTVFYQVKKMPQIPSIQYWRQSGGGTSERGSDSPFAELRAIVDNSGRILVLMSHNTDIADGWERETDDVDFFYRFTAEAYGVGINAAVYSMTH